MWAFAGTCSIRFIRHLEAVRTGGGLSTNAIVSGRGRSVCSRFVCGTLLERFGNELVDNRTHVERVVHNNNNKHSDRSGSDDHDRRGTL